jgi:hypothetical protein
MLSFPPHTSHLRAPSPVTWTRKKKSQPNPTHNTPSSLGDAHHSHKQTDPDPYSTNHQNLNNNKIANKKAALLLVAALALLLAGQAQASGGYKHGGLNADGTKKNWLPAGVTADQVAAIRLTFPDGKIVDKPYPPPARAAGDGSGKKWGGGGHHGAGTDGSQKWDPSLRPTKSIVLKTGQVIALPKPDWKKNKPAFNKADVVGVTATFADGTTKALPLPGSGGAPKQRPPAGTPRPTSITVELKNGTKITKSPHHP